MHKELAQIFDQIKYDDEAKVVVLTGAGDRTFSAGGDFDAHDRAFAFFKGACTRGIYDNMKTAVETTLVGKERVYNRRFLQMCGHYLVDPVCTPASGWEKGQVENQVGLARERFFTPRLRVKSYDELNAVLLDKAIAYARAHRHPELRDRTIWEVFETERPNGTESEGSNPVGL